MVPLQAPVVLDQLPVDVRKEKDDGDGHDPECDTEDSTDDFAGTPSVQIQRGSLSQTMMVSILRGPVFGYGSS